MFPPPGLTVGVVFIAPDTTGRVDDKELDLRFLQNFPFNRLDCSVADLRRACTRSFLSRGTLCDIKVVLLVNVNKLLPCSFGLIRHLSHIQPQPMRRDLAWNSRPRVTDD